MNTILTFLRLIFVIGLLYITFNSSKFKSANPRRLAFALGGLFVSGSYLIGLLTQESQNLTLARLVLWSLPAIGGIFLMVSILLPGLQENLFEYFAWALVATWIISFTYTFNIPTWAEWSLVIMATTLVFIIQIVTKQPASQP